MSHQVRVTSKMNNLTLLQSALDDLGIRVEAGGKVRGRQCALTTPDKTVGFAENADGTYSLVGDPYYCKQQSVKQYYGQENNLRRGISGKYLLRKAQQQARRAGFRLDPAKAKTEQDGTITVEATSF